MSLIRPPFRLNAGYTIANSALFDGSTSYLSRTFASAGNTKTFTISYWIKKDKNPAAYYYTMSAVHGANCDNILYDTDERLAVVADDASGGAVPTAGVYRDLTAWAHVCITVDTTQATAANRVRVYVNGIEASYGNSATYTLAYPALDYVFGMNSNVAHTIMRLANSATYGSGYLAEFHFVDGLAKTADDFGQIDTVTDQWKPKRYAGTYGTNGFYLDFSNSGALGTDASGNGNNWTVNGTVTQSTDTPTNNYATLNPLDKYNSAGTTGTLSNGNLTASGFGDAGCASTMTVSSGKWWWEWAVSGAVGAGQYVDSGIVESNVTNYYDGSGADGFTFEAVGYYGTNGYKMLNGSAAAYGATFTSGDRIGAFLDLDSGTQTITFYKQTGGTGAFVYQGAITLTSGKTWKVLHHSRATAASVDYNFGATAFANTSLPTGAKSLGTNNLPAVTGKNIDDHFKTVLDTGANIKTTAEAQFTNYLAWIKDRANANNHQVFGTLRGTTAILQTNTAAAETTYAAPAGNSVAWVANLPSSETNTSGTISVQWKYNAIFGMAEGIYTCPASISVATLGLPAALAQYGAPKMAIFKSTTAGATNWPVYHFALGNTNKLNLNGTSAAIAVGAASFNSTDPTSSLFTLGSGDSDIQQANQTFTVICFWETDLCKIGSYAANSSADGPMVNRMVSPVWYMTKPTDYADIWQIWDAARSPENVANEYLAPNSSATEATSTGDIDFTAVGVKNRQAANHPNYLTYNHVYLMIGQPTGGSNIAEATGR